MKAKRLKFTTSLESCLDEVEVIFSAVGTPPDEDGSADLKYVLEVAHKVTDSISFFKEFRIRSHIKINRHASLIQFFLNNRTNLTGSAYRNGTFGNYQFILFHIATNGTGHLQHVFLISASVFIRRGANRTEYNFHIVQTTF